ncbi:MAG TPA: hypothetical protein VNS63_15500 [Blastocatellia bacterium]|nr:hypothetical protein [Blastocatellia bacterium]
MTKVLLVALSISIWLQGCCPGRRTEPNYPTDVSGWRDTKEGTTKLRGSFVLKKGEQTDNGKLQITVSDLLSPECTGDAGDFAARARVKLKFSRLSEKQAICSEVFPETGGGELVGGCAGIPSEFGVFGVSVRAINLKEGWVSFVLTGDY